VTVKLADVINDVDDNLYQATGLFEGRVSHSRFSPTKHSFQYSYFCLWLGLDNLEQAKRERPEWFKKGRSVCHYNPANYKSADDVGHADFIRAKAGLDFNENNQVWMLGQLTYMGSYFSPVNFYFIGRHNAFHTLVAQVSNTPWDETHHYVVPLQVDSGVSHFQHEKQFHVSPFMTLNQDYKWEVRFDGDASVISISSIEDEQVVFSAAVNLSKSELNRKVVLRVITNNFGWMYSTKIRIYWQALKLFLKGVSFVSHPGEVKNDKI
jgi:DUF1365 family protein